MTSKELTDLKTKTEKATNLIKRIEELDQAIGHMVEADAVKLSFGQGSIFYSPDSGKSFYSGCSTSTFVGEQMRQLVMKFLSDLKSKVEQELAEL